jgi:hypothetical protein
MALAGKDVKLSQVVVGMTVELTLKGDGGGAPTVSGAVYTVDPVTQTVVLFSAAANGRREARDVRHVPAHAVAGVKVVADASPRDAEALVQPLPAVDLKLCAKREAEAFEAMETAMAQLNPNATPEGQAMFDALSKTMDCSWVDDSINVLDQVRVDAPYGVDDCVSLDGNTDSLARIRKVMQGSLKKMAQRQKADK